MSDLYEKGEIVWTPEANRQNPAVAEDPEGHASFETLVEENWLVHPSRSATVE